MKVSVITVVYNNEATVAQAISSVLSQSYHDIEYIVIDGGSSDRTLDVIKGFGDKISRVVSEPDDGLYDAMNKGVRMATGDIIAILNSDDLYSDEQVIEDVMNIFDGDSALDIVYGDLVYVEKLRCDKVVRRWSSSDYYESFFEDGNVPPHPSVFIRSRVYHQAGLFNTDFKLAADYELMLRFLKLYSFRSRYIKRLIVKMRLGGATNNSIANIIKGNIEILQAWRINRLRVPIMLIPRKILKRVVQFL